MRDTGLLEQGAQSIGVDLAKQQLDQFLRYHRELEAWNRRVNLTADTGWEHVQARHFMDSLTVAQAVPSDVLASGTMADIGSGAGFPGVPLRIAFPGLQTTLIDATAKRTRFLAHLAEALGLDDVTVLNGRSEVLAHEPALRGRFDLVVARAVAHMAVLAELMLPFCRTGGTVIAQKASDVDAEVRDARGAIDTMGGALREIRRVEDFSAPGRSRTLVVLSKVSDTPERYPRRPGIPEKRPLVGGSRVRPANVGARSSCG